MDHVKPYRLWHDGSVRLVRDNWIMRNHIDYYMMNCPVQLGQVVSCQIILFMTWWISQVSQVKLGHVKSYWLWHDVSVRSVSSNRITSNHISYYMMCKSGQLGQIRSCQIISAITWCLNQVRSYHYHSHWNNWYDSTWSYLN